MKTLIVLLLLNLQPLFSKDLQRQQVLMGTFAKITLEKQHQHQIQKGFQLIKAIENSLSSYDKKALLYQLNQTKTIETDTFLLEAIQKSKNYYQLSNGYFDITIGSITKKLYHFGEAEEIPTKKALKKAKTNINAIHIHNNTITLEKNITLDLGGMGKGYAVDKVANYYKEENITHGIIALWGDIQALHPTTIYIDSPFHKKPFVALRTLYPNTSVSTSGTYRRYIKNQKYHHLINPKSKKQGRAFVSITLITHANNSLIDAMATAIGVMSQEEALHFLVQHQNIGYLLVRPNGNLLYGNLKKFVTLKWI